MTEDVLLTSDSGKGRAIVVLYEHTATKDAAPRYAKIVERICAGLQDSSRLITLSVPEIHSHNWTVVFAAVSARLQELKVRSASYVGLGGACSAVQFLCLQNIRSVRTATLIDGTTRPHPTLLEKIFDTLERYFALGLPFRMRGRGFYSRPFLQRMRCPILVVDTPEASIFEKREAEILTESLPTSWRLHLASENELDELAADIATFQTVPAKCPQKNLGIKTARIAS